MTWKMRLKNSKNILILSLLALLALPSVVFLYLSLEDIIKFNLYLFGFHGLAEDVSHLLLMRRGSWLTNIFLLINIIYLSFFLWMSFGNVKKTRTLKAAVLLLVSFGGFWTYQYFELDGRILYFLSANSAEAQEKQACEKGNKKWSYNYGVCEGI